MNRLQKKCVLATVGFHLLLLVILFVGPAFFSAKPKIDNSDVLDVIPANLIDAQFKSGVKNAEAPARVVEPAPQPAPKPIVIPPAPTPEPRRVEPVEPVKPVKENRPKIDLTPVVKPESKPVRPRKIKLEPVTRVVPKNSATKPRDDSRERFRAEALRAARALKNNFAPTTTIEMPGGSSAAYANYASVVKSIYEQAWSPPDSAENDDANIKVSVTIASDGSVISARIVAPSGDSGVDATVQRTLDRVTFIAPFPDGAKEKQRTYIIN
ncbi:MAG: TonB family protein, partial [Limisphaerales bacterium]